VASKCVGGAANQLWFGTLARSKDWYRKHQSLPSAGRWSYVVWGVLNFALGTEKDSVTKRGQQSAVIGGPPCTLGVCSVLWVAVIRPTWCAEMH
jgi:hypothetical protein